MVVLVMLFSVNLKAKSHVNIHGNFTLPSKHSSPLSSGDGINGEKHMFGDVSFSIVDIT